MHQAELTPLAGVLIDSYQDVPTYSRWFHDEQGQPPTYAAKIHHLRSVAQARINGDERYQLDSSFAEFGRVQVTDLTTDRCYLLRSDGAVTIERHKRQKESLFAAARYISSPTLLLVYRFHREGLDLSLAGTCKREGRLRLEASGPPSFIGTWPYSDDCGGSGFDQGEGDDFGDLDQGFDEDGEEGGRE